MISAVLVRQLRRRVHELETSAAEAVRRREMLAELLEEFNRRGPSPDAAEAALQERLWTLYGSRFTTAA